MTNALITGASRGIGRAIAQRLATQGIRVFVGARNQDDADRVASEIGHDATGIRLDVTEMTSIRDAAELIGGDREGLDILVNNAGILPEATQDVPQVVDIDLFRQTYETNLFGPVAVVQTFLPLMRDSEHGRIVNVSTTMGSLTDQTNPDSPYYGMVMPAYQSSKAALNNLTISLAKALVGTGIKVTSVCPGFVQTDLTPMNQEQAPDTAEQAADVVVHAATLSDTETSGTFIDRNGSVPW